MCYEEKGLNETIVVCVGECLVGEISQGLSAEVTFKMRTMG